jgi:hypothetical protein
MQKKNKTVANATKTNKNSKNSTKVEQAKPALRQF